MTIEDILIQIFCLVDDQMKDVPKQSQAKLYLSELVTIGLLFALKGGHFRAFSRWLQRDDDALFAGFPDRTRLQRLLVTHQDWNERFLADPSFCLVIDSFPIELLFPFGKAAVRSNSARNPKTRGAGASGSSCVGYSTASERLVDWDWDTMNVPDNEFHPLIQQLAWTQHRAGRLWLSQERWRARERQTVCERHLE